MLEDYPFTILAIGIAIVIGMIIFLKINAFLALITAAMAVSLLGPESVDGINRIKRVAIAFGDSVSGIGIVIALAAIIGKCMMDSGAADRIVRTFLKALGEKNASVALMGSGFVLAVPVFFDTVFYLLIPLARSLYRSTKKNYLMYIMAIAAGGAITHTLVPPTPGPLSMADNLGVDLGKMIFVGVLVALPAAFAGIFYAMLANRKMNIPMREVAEHKDPDPLEEHELPSLFVSLTPIVLPVLMITANTLVSSMLASGVGPQDLLGRLSPFTSLIGDPNFALLVATAISLVILFRQRKLTLLKLGATVETALMSGGVIILITAGGGAFGKMLTVAQIGPAIQEQFGSSDADATGLSFLFLGFGIAALLKVAQGSSTVAMITTSAMLATMNVNSQMLGFDPVYLATAIGAGSLIGSWMNDSGFWIFCKMSGLTETEALKSWTPLLIVLGCTSMATTILLTIVFPMS
ncbi:MAG: GntP family permease [Planctomycetes bacterium]|nr:GntP family permease [Planctomycetota bacterium]MCH9727874.1 GntP family permease [Planctomycetota bacterium]MCH9775458.1 GntP family permease [Planctomycetota bacterium]MDF1743525.1 SLC13 family permease [Gimesia sp.]